MTHAVTRTRIQEILSPFMEDVADPLADQLLVYLNLLLRWNERTNLTSIRYPEQIVARHFGESLYTAQRLPRDGGTLLDFGSGAGFPGLPIALARPDWKVTLAEAQGKKAAFLQEAVRSLAVPVEVWSRRVESMRASRLFDVVCLRAVDETGDALELARARVRQGGWLIHLTSSKGSSNGDNLLPGSDRRVLAMEQVV